MRNKSEEEIKEMMSKGIVRVWLDIGHYRDIGDAENWCYDSNYLSVMRTDKMPTVFKEWAYAEWIDKTRQLEQ